MIQSHPAAGARILEPIKPFSKVIPAVRQHHEKYDGSGYPEGLSGENIDLGARILAVADVFDALKSDRPYRKGLPQDEVLNRIHNLSGSHFDPAVVKALAKVLRRRLKAA
jgi:HD-GYP domain-containing protein (c-di-GMP phosphodiesterase class II)